MITAELTFAVSPTPPPEFHPTLEIRATTSQDVDLVFDVEPRDDLAQALIPRAVEQVVHVEADVDMPTGTARLPASQVVEMGWEDNAPDGQTWSLAVAAQVVDDFDRWRSGPLKTEIAFAGAPPPGLGAVDLIVGLETQLGKVQEFRVVSGGLTQSATRPVTGFERVLRMSGPGYWGRFDRALVTLFLPPGHGLTHGRLVREILTQLGFTEEQLPGDFGTPLVNPVELHCEAGWPEAQRVADGDGRWLRLTQDFPPRVEAVPIVPDLATPPVRTFTADDVLAGETAELASDGDVPTHFVVTGSRVQLPSGTDGKVTENTVVETWTNDFVLPQARFRQDGQPGSATYGDLIPLAYDPTPRRELVSRITTRRTTEGGCLTVVEVITEGWMAPQAARYVREAPDALEYRPVYIYDEGAARDDQAIAYEDRAYRFRVTSITRTETYYGRLDTSRGLTTEQRRLVGLEAGLGALVAARPGDLLLTTVYRGGWYNPRRAIADAAENVTDGVLLSADQAGVLLPAQGFFSGPGDPSNVPTPRALDRSVPRWLSVERTVVTGNPEGYMTGTLLVERTHARDRKRTWRYADDTWSSEENEVGFISNTVGTTYTATTPSTHTKVEETRDVTGELVTNGLVSTEAPEYLPRRDNCTPESALASSNAPISGEVFCEAPRVYSRWEEQHPYVETVGAAVARARVECIRDNAPALSLSVLVDPRLRAGDPVVVDLPDGQIYARRGWIESLSGQSGQRPVGGVSDAVTLSLVVRLDPRG